MHRSLWLKHRDMPFSSTIEVESICRVHLCDWSIEFCRVLSLLTSVLTTFTDVEALSFICMRYWATGDVVKLFIYIILYIYIYIYVYIYINNSRNVVPFMWGLLRLVPITLQYSAYSYSPRSHLHYKNDPLQSYHNHNISTTVSLHGAIWHHWLV